MNGGQFLFRPNDHHFASKKSPQCSSSQYDHLSCIVLFQIPISALTSVNDLLNSKNRVQKSPVHYQSTQECPFVSRANKSVTFVSRIQEENLNLTILIQIVIMDMRVGLQKDQVQDIFTAKTYNYENLWVVLSIFLLPILVHIDQLNVRFNLYVL